MSRSEVVGYFVWRLACCRRRSVIDYLLYLRKNLRQVSQVFEGMNEKAKGNFYHLISFLAGAISLEVVGCAVK